MKKTILTIILGLVIFCSASSAQDKEQKPFTPYVAVYAGGCVDNPFQFVAGMQKPLQQHLTIAYDIHYWKTGYESYCDDDVYAKGNFRSITPSVKIIYNTGKKEGKGLMAGIGLGYMFAKDRGTEQSYLYNESVKAYTYGPATAAQWDFNSIAPSFTLGVGFRVLRLPMVFNSTYYFAKTTEGWMATAGGVGLKIGFRKLPGGCCKKKCE